MNWTLSKSACNSLHPCSEQSSVSLSRAGDPINSLPTERSEQTEIVNQRYVCFVFFCLSAPLTDERASLDASAFRSSWVPHSSKCLTLDGMAITEVSHKGCRNPCLWDSTREDESGRLVRHAHHRFRYRVVWTPTRHDRVLHVRDRIPTGISCTSSASLCLTRPPDLRVHSPVLCTFSRLFSACGMNPRLTCHLCQLNVLFENLGGTKAGGVLASLVGGVGFLLVLACLVYGRRWREKAL